MIFIFIIFIIAYILYKDLPNSRAIELTNGFKTCDPPWVQVTASDGGNLFTAKVVHNCLIFWPRATIQMMTTKKCWARTIWQ